MRSQVIIVDINKEICRIAKYKQYDNNNLLRVMVEEDNKKVDLTDCTGLVFFELPSGKILEKSCTINKNTIDINIDNNILSENGKIICEITLNKGDVFFTLFRISLMVERSIDREEAIESEVGMELIAELLEICKIEEERKQNELSRQSRENERVASEITRIQNETNRQSNEDKRMQNENARKANENERIQNENTRKTNEDIRIANENERIQKMSEIEHTIDLDILKQITQQNIDKWNSGASGAGMTDEEREQLAQKIDDVEITNDNILIFYSNNVEVDRVQLEGGMSNEEKEQLAQKFDNVEVNTTESNDEQTALDFYANGKLIKTIYFTGGSGSGGSTSAYISSTTSENLMVNVGENFDLSIDFNSPNLGRGTLRVSINDIDVMSTSIMQGESTITISSEYLIKGTNRMTVYALDRVGQMSNTLTFYVRYGSTELTSDFNPYTSYDYGSSVRYYFTPSALDTSQSLTFYMSIDGEKQNGVTCTSDVRAYYTFPNNLSVDNHYCEAWVEDANGNKSTVLKFDLVIIDDTSLVIASDTKNPTVEEGLQLTIDYKVYMKNNISFITKTYVDNNLVNTGTCGLETAYYKTSSLTEGTHTVKVEVWNESQTVSDSITWSVIVTPSEYEMLQPITTASLFVGNAMDRTNSDERRDVFIGKDQDNNEVLANLYNFAYNNESGWVDDTLIISGNSYVELPIKPLENNAEYGFTLDIEFLSKQIGVEDAEVLTLWNEEKNCGIRITTENLILRSAEGNECNLYFSDNEMTNVMFIIDRNEAKAKIYLNGVMCEAFHLSDYVANGISYLEDFTVNNNVILGGKNKNGYSVIKNLRIYEVALTTNEILNNFMANERDKTKQQQLVEFQKGNDLPTLTIYCDFSGLGKDDKKPCKIVYNSTDEVKYGKSFVLDHKKSTCQYQGTSSMAYPIKNYRLNLRDENGEKWYYNFPFGQPECRFTLKADFMSSGHWQNTGFTKWVNDNLYHYDTSNEKSMNPKKWYDINNGGSLDDTRECIYGFPCRLILVNDGNTALNEGQNEPTPGNTKDMGIFNFNHDKDATDTMGFDQDVFPNCASYEISANSDTSAGAFMSYEDNFIVEVDSSFRTGIIPLEAFGCMNDGDSITFTNHNTASRYFKVYNSTDKLTRESSVASNNTITITRDTNNRGVSFNYWSADENQYWMVNDIRILANNTGIAGTSVVSAMGISELEYIKQSFELRFPDEDDVSEDWGFMGIPNEEGTGLKALIDWVDNCTDEEFVRDFEQHFHKDYTLRYYLMVIVAGMVDNLGKNLMLDTWDNKIFMPRFYDCDTICSYDNSGDIKFDVDIEMEQGYWNTSSSRLWTRVRDLMHNDLVEKYNDMRKNGLSYESLMQCFYDEQIAKIPQKYYNMDYDVKYAPFADSYMGMAHGNGYEHLKHWLKRRLIFCDTLFDYAPSYNNDMLTIRANTTELMNIEIETYTPVYQHVSWYNGQMDKKKIDGKIAVSFSGTAMAETDQEVLIYGGSNIKKISGITSMNPNQMLIGSATRLSELSAPNCPLLADINSNKANLSPHTYLNKVDLSNCPQLGGILRLNNSQLIRDVNISRTAIDGLQLPTNVRNLETFKLSEDVANVTLRDAVLLKELNIPTNIEYLLLINVPNLTKITSTATSFNRLNTLIMENPTINPISNITSKAPNLQYVRLTNLDIACSSAQIQSLLNMKGVDSFGNEIPLSQAVSGKVTLSQCSKDIEQALKETFPLVEFIVTSYVKSYTVTFVDGDGNTIYETHALENGEAIYAGDTPTKTSTVQYDFEFKGWDRQLKPITSDVTITATFNSVLRYYTIRFINSDTLEVIDSQYLAYGSTPTKPTIPEGFNSFKPSILEKVVKDFDYYTQYIPYPDDISMFTFKEVEVNNNVGYACILNANITDLSYLILPFQYNDKPVLMYSQASTSIGSTSVTEVYIPDTIQILGQYAFRSFKSLTSIESSSIIRFSDYTDGTSIFGETGGQLSYCDNLISIKFPRLNVLGEPGSNNSTYAAFTYCPNLKYVWFGSEEYPVTSFEAYYQSSESIFHFRSSLSNLSFINIVTKNGLESDISLKATTAIKNKIVFSKSPIELYSDDNFDYMIIGNEAIITAYKGTDTEIEIPNTVKDIPITKIDDSVFYNSSVRTEITSVNLPSTVTSLGNNCFQNCSKLASIDLPNVTSLGTRCFMSCSNLASIGLPSVTSLSESCFYKCTGLTEINLPSATSLGMSCFSGCNGLTSINIPNVTSLGSYCFANCSALTSIELPLVTSLDNYCFQNCSNLASIDMPKVTSLGGYCFDGCSGLTEINLPLVTSIEIYCFSGCSKLTSIDLSNITSLGNYCFQNCSNLASINIPNVTSLGNYCFQNCSNLASIDMPKVTSLGNSCFYGCSKLTSIDIPNVTSLGNSCFMSCSNLASIEMPSVTSIGQYCFSICTVLKTVTLGGIGKSITDTSGFNSTCFTSYIINLTIYVSNPSNPPTLTGSPWGATNATITYKQA